MQHKVSTKTRESLASPRCNVLGDANSDSTAKILQCQRLHTHVSNLGHDGHNCRAPLRFPELVLAFSRLVWQPLLCEKSFDELRRCSRDTQLKFVFVFARVSSVSPAEPLLELSSQPVALKYYYSTTVLLPYFYGTTVLLLYYYCTTARAFVLQPVALKYYYSTTVLLPYFYGTTVLLLYYYCTTAHYQGSDLVDCGGECRLEGKVFKMKGI